MIPSAEIYRSSDGKWHVRVYDVIHDFDTELEARAFLDIQ